MSKDDIKPGDHITVAGVVTEVNFIGLITIKTKSGWEFTFDPKDIQTHRPMKEDHKE